MNQNTVPACSGARKRRWS